MFEEEKSYLKAYIEQISEQVVKVVREHIFAPSATVVKVEIELELFIFTLKLNGSVSLAIEVEISLILSAM